MGEGLWRKKDPEREGGWADSGVVRGLRAIGREGGGGDFGRGQRSEASGRGREPTISSGGAVII